ncbi:MAG: phosphocholine cytidylyltransferase family protein [Myxococcota bacterium]|nr:phosphocholine cytidylyltransferase family protein [Myxococcota bacterium]
MSEVVLLGAGLGARLRPLTDDRPKCVVEIGGEPLARRMLRQFADRGIARATVVVGHFAERAKELIGDSVGKMPIRFVENTEYATTNTMYSTLLAIDTLADGGFLVEGDIVAHDAVIDRLVGADDRRSHWAVDAWTAAHSGSRLWTSGGKRIVKQEIYRAQTTAPVPDAWKSSGMLRLTGATAQQLGQRLRDEPDRTIYYDDVIGKHVNELELDVLDLEGMPWVEIDDLADMAQARKMFEDQP